MASKASASPSPTKSTSRTPSPPLYRKEGAAANNKNMNNPEKNGLVKDKVASPNSSLTKLEMNPAERTDSSEEVTNESNKYPPGKKVSSPVLNDTTSVRRKRKSDSSKENPTIVEGNDINPADDSDSKLSSKEVIPKETAVVEEDLLDESLVEESLSQTQVFQHMIDKIDPDDTFNDVLLILLNLMEDLETEGKTESEDYEYFRTLLEVIYIYIYIYACNL